jgi:two-component system sensor histidine kinase/response regulator
MESGKRLRQFDREIALGRVGGDEELLQEVAGIFLDEYTETLDQIRKAAESHDSNALERAAHSLKGSVGNFGANAAFEAARRLETIARSRGEMTGLTEALLELEAALERLRPELTELASDPS